MNSLERYYHFHLFSLVFLIFLICACAAVPRLRVHPRTTQYAVNSTLMFSSSVPKDFETFYFSQRLDHFSYRPESFITFKQRYVVSFKYWGGSNSSSPILAFFGAEESLDEDLVPGFLTENAPKLKALQIYIEHRYYGESVPFGSIKEAMKNASYRGYFNSAQAIADYAAVLLHLKKKLSAKNCPIIVVGGSYGGMLAAWFRLKYPHIAIGALASSAPVLYFDDITSEFGYYSIVTKDFKETSESCYKTIRKSWAKIDEVASKPNGLSILSKRFKTCHKVKTSIDLKNYLDSIYTEAAQYNAPSTSPLSEVCNAIDGAPNGSDTLSQIFEGVMAYMGNNSCYDTNAFSPPNALFDGWTWQTCSEMVMPVGRGSINEESMFPREPFNLKTYIKDCKRLYGILPQPHWVTTYYGGHNLKLILSRFASNIIFSNGLKDPYSSGGVLENISESVVAISTVNGSHCLDIQMAKPSDPKWLVKQRKVEVEIIKGWITKYHADLRAFKQYLAPLYM